MATAEFHYDHVKEEGVITFRLPDNEVQKAEISGLARLAIRMSEDTGTLSAIALSLLIILEGIEASKDKERKEAARQN